MTMVFTIAIALVGTNSAFAELSETQVHNRISIIVESQENIDAGIDVVKNQRTILKLTQNLNSNGVFLEGQSDEVLSDWLMRDVEFQPEPKCSVECSDLKKIKIKSAYMFYDSFWGISYQTHRDGEWTIDVGTGESTTSFVNVIDNELINAYWITSGGSHATPVTATYDVVTTIQAPNPDNDDENFYNGIYRGESFQDRQTSTFTWSWDTDRKIGYEDISPRAYTGDWVVSRLNVLLAQ